MKVDSVQYKRAKFPSHAIAEEVVKMGWEARGVLDDGDMITHKPWKSGERGPSQRPAIKGETKPAYGGK